MIYRATVIANTDPLKMGRVLIVIPGRLTQGVWASYASPFGGPTNSGGFVAIPEVNSTVLVAEVANHEDVIGKYIWFACLYDNPDESQLDNLIPKADEVYGDEGIPHKVILKSRGGNWIELSDPYPLVDADHEDLIRIQTSEGKRLILDSTLNQAKMVLVDESGNGLEVSDDGGIAELKANSVHLTAKDQDIYITVNEGNGDISIIHNGDGKISVETLNGDIDLKAPQGSINIEAPAINLTGQNVKIETERLDII